MIVLPAALFVALWIATPALSQQLYPITTTTTPPTITVQPPVPVTVSLPAPSAQVAGITTVRPAKVAAPAQAELAFTGMEAPALVATAALLFALGGNLMVAARRREARV